MSKDLVCIVGRTASGKDTAARYLQSYYGFHPVVSYTTRPKRLSEKEGREHLFISDEKMQELLSDKENIAAYTKIEDAASGKKGYEYCTTVEQLEDADMYVIDPNGIHWLREQHPEFNLHIVYISVPKEIQRERALKRSPEDNAALEARMENEDAQFTAFESEFHDFDIVNDGTEDDLYQALDVMYKRLSRFLSM